MTQSRIDQAIQRIEVALGRIDAASRNLVQASAPAGDMKQAVNAILDDLDQLIAEMEQ